MKIFCLLAVAALIASVASHRGGGRGGWGGWGGGRGRGRGGDGDGDGDRWRSWGWGWGSQPSWPVYPPTPTCPTTNRIIIISDYVSYRTLDAKCVDTCYYQSNSVLSTIGTQSYTKSDSVIIMVGPYSYPNPASTILSNTTFLNSLAATTTVYLTTIPVHPSVTDPTVIRNIAATNALVTTASSTPGVRLIDYQAYFNSLQYKTLWSAGDMCAWLRNQLAGVVPVPAVAAVPAAPAGTVPGATLAPF